MESKINEKAVQIFAKAPGELGVNVVKSPVKLTILSMLKDTDMEFDEIVKNTGKSKSTISVHLKSLREDGIVNYRFDANDHRKKIFYISSKFLGEVKFSFLLFHTLRSTLIQEGVNINPILTETGKNMGYAIFKKIYDEDINKFSQNIMDFWKDNGMGILEVDLSGDVIEVTNYDCFECELLPKTGTPSCYLDAGILEALYSSFFELNVDVTEVKCFTMGDNCCNFLVEPTEE